MRTLNLPPRETTLPALRARDLGDHRLMLALNGQPGGLALLAQQRTANRRHRAAARAALTGVVVALALTFVAAIFAPGSRAAVTDHPATVKVSVDRRVQTFTARVRTDDSYQGAKTATAWIIYPDTTDRRPVVGLWRRVGAGITRHGNPVTVTSTVRTARFAGHWGRRQILFADPVDQTYQVAQLDIRRRSSVTVVAATLDPAGRMHVAGRVRHYDPVARGYVPSRLSPVSWQVSYGRGWVTAGSSTTGRAGYTARSLRVGPGVRAVRAVRPDGATVWAATSRPVTVR